LFKLSAEVFLVYDAHMQFSA